jgi:hypothetical protein
MGVHGVESVVGEIQVLHIGDGEGDVRPAAGADLGAGKVQRVGRVFKRGHLAGRDHGREVGGDGARPAADVEQ